MNWKDLSGAERYRVVQMARRGEVPMAELCATFGVSRQTLSEAMEKVDRAAMAELEPKTRGRKGKTREEAELAQERKEKAKLEKELTHWKTKCEIAMTFVELQRKVMNGEALPGEEEEEVGGKRRAKRERETAASTGSDADGTEAELAGAPDGGRDGRERGKP